MTPIGIIGVGHAVPDNDVKNVDLVAMGVETTDEWIRERTGISARRIADADTNTSDLAIKAAQQAIDRSGINPDDIGVVICATSTPDFGGFPSTACCGWPANPGPWFRFPGVPCLARSARQTGAQGSCVPVLYRTPRGFRGSI